jgi:elongation factor G
VSLGDSSISVVVMPNTPADQDRLDRALRQMIGEVPRLHALRDPQTGHTLVSAGDIQQLEIVIDRLKRQFQVEAGLGKPTTAGPGWRGPRGGGLS